MKDIKDTVFDPNGQPPTPENALAVLVVTWLKMAAILGLVCGGVHYFFLN